LASEEEGTALLAKDLRDLSTQELHRKYSAEASTHRNILIGRGTGVAPQWRDFKVFLGEVGAKPSADHSLVLLNRYERTYGPGRARWMTADTPAELREFENAYPLRLAHDAANTLAYLCTSPYDVRLAQERFPKIHFHPLREHAGLSLSNSH